MNGTRREKSKKRDECIKLATVVVYRQRRMVTSTENDCAHVITGMTELCDRPNTDLMPLY